MAVVHACFRGISWYIPHFQAPKWIHPRDPKGIHRACTQVTEGDRGVERDGRWCHLRQPVTRPHRDPPIQLMNFRYVGHTELIKVI